MYAYMRMYTYMNKYVFICTHAHRHTHTHTRTHTHTTKNEDEHGWPRNFRTSRWHTRGQASIDEETPRDSRDKCMWMGQWSHMCHGQGMDSCSKPNGTFNCHLGWFQSHPKKLVILGMVYDWVCHNIYLYTQCFCWEYSSIFMLEI